MHNILNLFGTAILKSSQDVRHDNDTPSSCQTLHAVINKQAMLLSVT